MRDSYDVVIVGGAAIGAAVAYFLAADPGFGGSVLVIERDPTFAKAATSLSASAIRVQFSNPLNVEMSRFSYRFMSEFGETLQVGDQKPNLNIHAGGYLFLAKTEMQAATLRENHAVQTALGASVALWSSDEVRAAFPHLRTGDLALASYGQAEEGWFDNTALMAGFRAKARSLGVDFATDTVIGLDMADHRVAAVRLGSGRRVVLGQLVNASGTSGPRIADMAGLSLPVEIRKRTLFVFDCARNPEGGAQVNGGKLPLMVEPNGVYVRPEGRLFLVSCSPADDPEVDPDDFEPRYHEFEDIIWPTLAERSEWFEAIKIVNQWAGHFDFNTLDHNAVLGPHPNVTNFIFANGFSGHGLMHAPAIGRGIAEWIAFGAYRSLDLSPLGFERLVRNQPFYEKALL